MKLKALALLILVPLLRPLPGTEAEELAPDGSTPAFQIAMVLNAGSPDSLSSMKAPDANSFTAGSTTKSLPRLLAGEVPPYPESARRSRVQGSLVISGIIDPLGQLQELEIDSTNSQAMESMFKESTFEALKDWKFFPGTVNDQVVPVSLRLIVQFRLINPSKRISRSSKTKGT
ncbi:MAG: energy transducer TonB [Deltaproteobacteria bacterium]|nr:energy transducer TonB [Deltaproteobacteria bacterium]